MDTVYLLHGFYKDDCGAVEEYRWLHKTLAGARRHLAQLVAEDVQDRPDETRESTPTWYESAPSDGSERYELSIDTIQPEEFWD